MRIVLPLEIQKREIEGAISIAYEALKKNWIVYLGQKQQLWPFINDIPKSYWYLKSIMPGEINLLKKIKKKHIVGSLDIEGLVITSVKNEYFLKSRYSNKTCALVDKIFFFGNNHYNLFKRNFRVNKNKIKITGSPAFDYYSKLKKNKKKYDLLVLSGFGSAVENSKKSTLSLQLENKLQEQASKIKNKSFDNARHKYDRMLGYYADKYIEITKEYATKFPKRKILLRPHHNENSKKWKEIFLKQKNIKISSNTSIFNDVSSSKTVLHFNSTACYLSNYLKIPTIMYQVKNCKFSKFVNTELKNISIMIYKKKEIFNKFKYKKKKLEYYISRIFTNDSSKIIIDSFNFYKLNKKENETTFLKQFINYFIFNFKKTVLLKFAGILSLFHSKFNKYRYGLWPYIYKYSEKEKFKKKWPGLTKLEILEKLKIFDKNIKRKIKITKHFSGYYKIFMLKS